MKSTRSTQEKVLRTRKGTLSVTVEFQSPGKRPIAAIISLGGVWGLDMTHETLRQVAAVAIDLCTGTFKHTRWTYRGDMDWTYYKPLKEIREKSSKTSRTKKKLDIMNSYSKNLTRFVALVAGTATATGLLLLMGYFNLAYAGGTSHTEDYSCVNTPPNPPVVYHVPTPVVPVVKPPANVPQAPVSPVPAPTVQSSGGGSQVYCNGPTAPGWRVDLPNGGCKEKLVTLPKPVTYVKLSALPPTGLSLWDWFLQLI